MKRSSSETGRIAEDRALAFLIEHGLVPLTRNYRTPQGEIDLVMQDGGVTVFVEVRARKSTRLMRAVETIDHRKVRRIILGSRHYLQKAANRDSGVYRFDVISINGPLDKANIEWIKNAFDA